MRLTQAGVIAAQRRKTSINYYLIIRKDIRAYTRSQRFICDHVLSADRWL